MNIKIILFDLAKYGKNWLIIFIPFLLSFLTIWPLGEIQEIIEMGSEIGSLFVSLFLSVSAAGIFHLFIVYFPERNKNRKSLKLLIDHLIVLDEKILELLNKIDEKIINLDLIDDPESSFFSNLKSFNLNNPISIKISEKGSILVHIGIFLEIFLSSLGRFENVKEIFIANTQVFESEEIQFITDAIWNRDFLRNNDLSEGDTKICFVKILEFYIKSRRKIIKLSIDHRI